MTPYLVDRIEDAYGRVVKQNKPTVIDKLMTSDEAQYLTECMEEVVDSGTGGSMRWSSYNAAGKTGSAQYDNSDKVLRSSTTTWIHIRGLLDLLRQRHQRL